MLPQMKQERKEVMEKTNAQRDLNDIAGADYHFAFVPKVSCKNDSVFFSQVYEGCEIQANITGGLKIDCINKAAFPINQRQQAHIITNLTAQGIYDGIALAVQTNSGALNDAISNAVDAGIAFVTFDSDAPDSRRAAYIGTDNAAMGRELAKVLIQINPVGGKYAFVSARSANLIERENHTREALADSNWYEVDESPIMGTGNGTIAVERMYKLAEAHPDLGAIVSVYQNPMLGVNWEDFASQYGNVILVSTDAADVQMEKLHRGYADALVGQLPYDMGKDIVNTLLELQERKSPLETEVLGTNMLEILRVPLELPPVSMDYNYIGDFVIIGYVCFGIVALLSVGFAIWTFVNRKSRVVMASQPIFLFMLCFGVLTLGSSIIPLGIDDEHYSLDACTAACMAQPWLFFVGFAFVFSVLFSKTWRVNRIFHNPNKFTRLKVTPKDVILPMVVLMTTNVLLLTCWTVISPLEFIRTPDGTVDLWNRSISSTGRCRSDVIDLFIAFLTTIMLVALVMANIQAYKARDIETEFAESKYIALVLASVLQASVICIPLLVVEYENPLALYLIASLLIFVICMVILLFIFVPKYMHHRKWLAGRAKKKKKGEGKGKTATDIPSNASDGGGGLRIKYRQSVLINPGQRVSLVASTRQEGVVDEMTDEIHATSQEQEETEQFHE